MPTHTFLDWKRAIFRCGKKIKGLCGGVVLYAAQISPQIDTATAEKGRFRMTTSPGQLLNNRCQRRLPNVQPPRIEISVARVNDFFGATVLVFRWLKWFEGRLFPQPED